MSKNKRKDKYKDVELAEITLFKEQEIRDMMSVGVIFYHVVTQKDGELAYSIVELKETKAARYSVLERDRQLNRGRPKRFFAALLDGKAHRVKAHRLYDLFTWWTDKL